MAQYVLSCRPHDQGDKKMNLSGVTLRMTIPKSISGLWQPTLAQNIG